MSIVPLGGRIRHPGRGYALARPWRRAAMLTYIGGIAALVVATLDPDWAPPVGAWHFDKWAHVSAYAALAVIPFLALGPKSRRRLRLQALGLALALGGVAITLEWAQAGVAGRTASMADGIANLAGIALGLAAGGRLRRALGG